MLRYTAINAVGRLAGYAVAQAFAGYAVAQAFAGYAVAQAFAGHAPPSVTGLYLRARTCDVAAAVATLTDEPHPLADRVDTWTACA